MRESVILNCSGYEPCLNFIPHVQKRCCGRVVMCCKGCALVCVCAQRVCISVRVCINVRACTEVARVCAHAQRAHTSVHACTEVAH